MIILKSKREIALMKEAGQLVARVREAVRQAVCPGVSTLELDRLAEEMITQAGATPAFKGYRGFPASICTSVNDQVVHGIPSARRLQEGDILSVDIGVIYQGYVGDTAVTVAVGQVSAAAEKLLRVTEEALEKGLAQCRPDAHLGDVSHAVQSWVEQHGLSVVRDYVGHGIGRTMHEDPQVPNFGQAGTGLLLRPGMVFALEPMVNVGHWEVRTESDGWTVVTADGSLSAHFEHTVAVTDAGPEVLTR